MLKIQTLTNDEIETKIRNVIFHKRQLIVRPLDSMAKVATERVLYILLDVLFEYRKRVLIYSYTSRLAFFDILRFVKDILNKFIISFLNILSILLQIMYERIHETNRPNDFQKKKIKDRCYILE